MATFWDVVETGINVFGGGNQPSPQPVVSWPVASPAATTTVIPGTGGPARPAQNCAGRYLWDPVNGKWIHRRRKRRRQLVTKSDIDGIARLKGVGITGQALSAWIASH